MIKAILGALESNKYVTLTFSINGGQVQIVASARSDKGVNTPPVNLLTSEDDFDNVLVKVLENLWIKGRKTKKDCEVARVQDCEVAEPEKPGKDCESARSQDCEVAEPETGKDCEVARSQDREVAEPETGKDCESARVQDCEVAEPERQEPERQEPEQAPAEPERQEPEQKTETDEMDEWED